MCGFAGAFDPGADSATMTRRLGAMAAALRHRGPDDEGLWHDPTTGVGLAFRRLAILDLSVEGHQPMVSASGRYVIAYNGEVFNFKDLRAELEAAGTKFRGWSDTEVMLAAFEAWGLVPSISRFVGMFAFALWDRQERRLHLVRDRVGIKPLYYGWSRGVLLFGSELTSLRTHPAFEAKVDPSAIAAFLRFNFVPAPHAIFKGFAKLEPGCVRSFDLAAPQPGDAGRLTRYWSLPDVARAGLENPFTGSDREALDLLAKTLEDAVALRMIADVPLGAFLSGGIDSSLVVALMRARASGPVRTYTIAFAEPEYDEGPWARRVAERLGTEHTEAVVSAADCLAAVPRIASIFDEPFSDSSQVPTRLWCERARRHVTVALSGDGGDETFAGYKRYALHGDLRRTFGRVPRIARPAVAGLLRAVPVGAANRLFGFADPWLRRYGSAGAAGDKIRKAADLVAQPDDRALYLDLMSHWKNAEALVEGAHPLARLADDAPVPAFHDAIHPLMLDDALA